MLPCFTQGTVITSGINHKELAVVYRSSEQGKIEAVAYTSDLYMSMRRLQCTRLRVSK
jgi:hypothetical protein